MVSSILEPDRIKVKVDNGIAFLDGTVSYNREKLMMQTLTSWQKGVKGIINNLRVLPPKVARSDENLTTILKEILKNEFPVESSVQFTVTDGVVYLQGSVSTLWTKEDIEKSFSNVLVVKKVVNNLDINPIT